MVAKPKKTKGKLPISRHPLFAPMVGLWFAALFGLGSLAIRPTLLESAVLALRLDLAVPAAAPPLGFTFRILLALSLFVIGGAVGFILARRMARPAANQGEGLRFSRVKAKASDPAPVTADDYDEDDDFARLDSARQVQEEAAAAAAANALPGRRRALAMEEDFSTEFHDAAPLPGHDPHNLEPQILDLSELGAFEEVVEPPVVEASAHPAPVEVEAGDEEPQFDPWHRHPAAPAQRVVQEFIADEPEPAAEAAPDFSRPNSEAQVFAAPACEAPASFAPPASFEAPASFAAPVPAEAASFDAPTHAVEAIVHPVTELHDAANDEAANDEAGVVTEGPSFAPPAVADIADAQFAEADFAAAPPEQPACSADAAPARPIFGQVTGDAAERLTAMPLTSLGVVQLAERLALAIARKRESAASEEAQTPALPADLTPPQPPVPVAFPVPPSLNPPAPLDFVPPAPLQIFPGYEAEMEAEPAPESVEAEAPASEVRPLFGAPAALPAALRPISFDEPEDEEQLPSILPPRTFPKLAEPAAPEAEEPCIPQSFAAPAAEAEDDGEQENYASLLDLGGQSRPFVRIEEPEAERTDIEPVVIFPGQENRAFAAPGADATVAARLFDTPPVPSAPLRMPPAAARSIDAEETERQLKAALATLQRMSGAA